MENECSKGRNRKYTQMDYEQPKRKLAHAQSSSLPSEIITEILIRLPIKILLRFQSVSKFWFALISSPQFVKAHLVKNKDYTHQRIMRTCIGHQMNSIKVYPMQSLNYESVTNPYDLDCPLKNHFMIVGSVNGLICLAFGAHRFLIWNPSIRKFKKVASLEIASGSHIAGFGYDELYDDYKLVSIFCGVKVEIYSLKRNSWRKIDDFQVGEVKSRLPTLVNSKLHWVTRCGDILSIDLTDEKWGRLEQPFYGEGDDGFDLGVLKTDLSMFRYYERMTCGHTNQGYNNEGSKH
ncbi:hypothetical protein HAX54_013142 [Datura stramonium]|uniref:F-box domain-containing protein n=1 Tax=Datura stramonium TaxID=4076 RepID=A0ABS8TML3_DATST|nr:hypothetical protein [Datura stramonium]